MSDASTSGGMSPQLLKVVEGARREPEGRFHSLAHRIDVPALERAYQRMRKDAAVGVPRQLLLPEEVVDVGQPPPSSSASGRPKAS
jgi:hypothetical protein